MHELTKRVLGKYIKYSFTVVENDHADKIITDWLKEIAESLEKQMSDWEFHKYSKDRIARTLGLKEKTLEGRLWDCWIPCEDKEEVIKEVLEAVKEHHDSTR